MDALRRPRGVVRRIALSDDEDEAAGFLECVLDGVDRDLPRDEERNHHRGEHDQIAHRQDRQHVRDLDLGLLSPHDPSLHPEAIPRSGDGVLTLLQGAPELSRLHRVAHDAARRQALQEPAPVSLVNDQFTVSNPVTAGPAFFRLRKLP